MQVEKGIQTVSLEKGTQKDYTVKYDYDEPANPHLYKKIDATSERLTHHLDNYWFNWFKPQQKNDATSETIETKGAHLKDNVSQTSRYIPGSLKQKSDNINQTVQYILKDLNPIATPPELSEADPPSEHFSEPPSEASSKGKKSKPGGGWWMPEPETTPEPTPKNTPKPTPPQSEQEEEGDIDEEDEYERRNGYMAWFGNFVAKNGHEDPPPGLPPVEVEEEELIPMEGAPMELPYPVAEEEELLPMAGVMDLPVDEELLESLWYNSRNKNKRKKK
jgi:hypothetical protein